MDRYISEANPQSETENNLIESVSDLIEDAKSRADKPNRSYAFPDPPIEER